MIRVNSLSLATNSERPAHWECSFTLRKSENNQMMNQTLKLGKIKVGKRIGGGGFGEVFEAKQEPLRQTLAIKIFSPSPFQNSEAISLERFYQEAEILMALRHRFITPIYGFGEYEKKPYILMERFKGMNLVQARDRDPAPAPEKVAETIIRLSDAMEYSHECGVVHRDIKPTNLLTIAGDARVIDFGIAKRLDPELQSITTVGNTISGDVFTAPELLNNPKSIDPRGDIYSLGASWFWALTGRAPSGPYFEQALRNVFGVSKEYHSVVMRCLAEVDDRYQTMGELKNELIKMRDGVVTDAMKHHSISDASALLLGTVFDHCTRFKEPVTVYRAQQELKNVNDFDFSIGMNQLESKGFLVDEEISHSNGDGELGLIITESGKEWVMGNTDRIRSLQRSANEPSTIQTDVHSDFDDDIPF